MKDEECFIVKDDPDIAYKAIGQSCPVCRDFFCIYCESFCHLAVYIRDVSQRKLKRTISQIAKRALYWSEKSVLRFSPNMRKKEDYYIFDIFLFNFCKAEMITISESFEKLLYVVGVEECIRFNSYERLGTGGL